LKEIYKEVGRDKRESERERHIQGVRSRRKSSGFLPSGEIKRKERLITKIMSDNYEQKLLQEIITGNYQLVYNFTRKMWEL
jgi:hypothetical protein